MNESTHTHKSIYSLGASDGFWVGCAMGLCVICMIASAHHAFLALIGLALFVAVPFLAWRFLRRAWLTASVPSTFSAVWLHGICIFLFGAIIMALMMYIALRFIEPGWIESQTQLAVERLSADAQTVAQAKVLARVAETGQLPSPIYTSISSIWLVAFSGSMWSMIFAFILTRVKKYTLMRVQYIENRLKNER